MFNHNNFVFEKNLEQDVFNKVFYQFISELAIMALGSYEDISRTLQWTDQH